MSIPALSSSSHPLPPWWPLDPALARAYAPPEPPLPPAEERRRRLHREHAHAVVQAAALRRWQESLHCVLQHAAAWLEKNERHPHALAVSMHLERISPGWRARTHAAAAKTKLKPATR